jgi:hypothetical protein
MIAHSLLIILQSILRQEEIYEMCVEYTLEIQGNRLQGSSPQFAGYDISISLPSDFFNQEFSIEHLIAVIENQDIRGEFMFPNGKTTEIKYSIIPYGDSKTIFMKTSNGWYPWEKMRVENDRLIFSYDYWYCPPARKMDLDILNLAWEYLKNSENWHQEDDRHCDDARENRRWSLFCALKMASIEIMKEYNHRNAAIQTVRFVIDDLYPDHGFVHTLKDFNNASNTTHDDILNVINLAKKRITEEIKTRHEK